MKRHKGTIAMRYAETYYSLGLDPEFWFMKDKEVVAAEEVLPAKGLPVYYGKVIIDGVQGEYNTSASGITCRESLASIIISGLTEFKRELLDAHPGLSISLAPVVKMKKAKLAALSDKARSFGCAPSKNINPFTERMVKKIAPKSYLWRSAGGHIHLGCKLDPERVVAVMDILLGNTCVLLDRDPLNKKRREVYGRAGEYRTPAHGLEYRTLSPFWMRNYQLMSFVMRMARSCASVVQSSTDVVGTFGTVKAGWYEARLLELVDMKKIHQAINENNFDLAMENFQQVKVWLREIHKESGYFCDMTTPAQMANFEFFVKMIGEKGLEYWFPQEPVEAWTDRGMRGGGWEEFINHTVKRKREQVKGGDL